MLPTHLALVGLAPELAAGEVATVAAAIQKQVTRDFGPIWTVEATVDAFPTLADVPLGYWPIMIVDTFENGGQHRDRDNQPYALVAYGSSWSLVASHEALEMLADPSGDRMIPGESPDPAQGRVEFLVEVCDPCQGDAFAYTVNGILVSDFYTPNYFDPVASAGVRYGFSGSITAPRQVLDGGYLSWREPVSQHWFQQHVEGGQSQITDLGVIEPGMNSLRSTIDGRTKGIDRLGKLAADRPALQRARARSQSGRAGAEAEARRLEALLRERHKV